MSRQKPIIQLHVTDRIILFGQILCRLSRSSSDGYTLRMLDKPHGLIFVSREELDDLVARAELVIEPGYFPAKSVENMPRGWQPSAAIAARKNHPGNGTVH
ncbi:hypothetical protein QTL95_17100 [Rhizobium sp. S152]|uniref:hypothetical protein n=1 Tax=Rhizobium sp. S152 TaxID=3055038 RepID=UPI0025AA10B3|nr:hypothetical protein [Rhizobium sp. S152]MDM9627622.1 hypothetical protein [Rhizobium sp. S152]